jgi:hypothetical protein
VRFRIAGRQDMASRQRTSYPLHPLGLRNHEGREIKVGGEQRFKRGRCL